MAYKFVDRAWMTTATTGTGTVVLGSAKAGYFTFEEAGMADADTAGYCIRDGNNFEIGVGTYTAAGTEFSRDTVIRSKSGGVQGTSKLNLSGAAEIFLGIPAQDLFKQSATLDLLVGTIQLGHASDTTIARSVAGRITVEGVTVVLETDVEGTQSVFIPAGAMTKRTTNGPGSNVEELATNDVMIPYWAFDASTSEAVQVLFRMPKSWDEGTLTFEFLWKHPATATNFGVKWGARARAFSNDDALDAAWGTEQEVADTGGTTDDLYTSPVTSALTPAGTPAEGDLVIVEFYRDPADASDTMAVDAQLIGVTMFYTTNAAVDT